MNRFVILRCSILVYGERSVILCDEGILYWVTCPGWIFSWVACPSGQSMTWNGMSRVRGMVVRDKDLWQYTIQLSCMWRLWYSDTTRVCLVVVWSICSLSSSTTLISDACNNRTSLQRRKCNNICIQISNSANTAGRYKKYRRKRGDSPRQVNACLRLRACP